MRRSRWVRLSELIEGDVVTAPAEIDIRGLTADSRAVRPGWLFAALPGSRTDGRRFIGEAIGRGAGGGGAPGAHAAPRAPPGPPPPPDPGAPPRRLAELAADGFDHLALEASSHGLDQFRL